MESPDTFQLVSLEVDPSTKAVSTTSNSTPIQTELANLTALHRATLQLDTPNNVPPPPLPVQPKRTQQITKLRESGNAALKKGTHSDAVRMYSLAIEMALGRPHWEPQGLVREEVAVLYSNRAQAYMAMREWADAAVDAEVSVEMKRVGNGKAWWRRGRCLVEMGRLEDAQEWVGKACELEPENGELNLLRKEISERLEKGTVHA